MFTKYIILFYLTYYYVPAVNSFDESEIMNLFNEIRHEDKFYVNYSSLSKKFDCTREAKELFNVMTNYGDDYVYESGFRERRVYFKKFKEAVKEGYIHRFKRAEMLALFTKITLNGAQKSYIIRSDLIGHYEGTIPTLQIDKVLEDHGTPERGGIHLSFFEFRRAVNKGSLPDW